MWIKLATTFLFALGACVGGGSDGAEANLDLEAPVGTSRAALTPSLAPVVAAASVGTLPGELTVTADGAANYSIAIEVPPGRAGMQPTISVDYSSRRGDGIAGVGWSLSAGSEITRCGSNLNRDGFTLPVEISARDHFCLAGSRLISVDNGVGREYRSEPDAGSQILHDTTGGRDEWTVKSRDGKILRYGTAASSQVVALRSYLTGDDSGATEVVKVGWLLAKVEDHAGNYMTYDYLRSPGAPQIDHFVEWELRQIDYTGSGATLPSRSVVFNYSPRTRPLTSYLRGVAIKSTLVLQSIVTYAQSQAVRTYHFGYNNPDGTFSAGKLSHRVRLASVQACASAGGCLPATTFNYSEATPTFTETDLGTLITDKRFFIADINGDLKDDLVYYDPSAYSVAVRLGPTLATPVLANPPLFTEGALRSFQVYDVTASDRAKLIGWYHDDFCCPTPANNCNRTFPTMCHTDKVHAFAWSGTGFGPTSTLLDQYGKWGDLTGNLRPQNIEDELPPPPGLTAPRIFGEGTPAWLALGHSDNGIDTTYPQYARILDLDGDGAVDSLLPFQRPGGAIGYDVVHRRAGTEAARTNLAFSRGAPTATAPANLNCSLFVDVNGDGLPDVVGLDGGVSLQLNLGNGVFALATQPLDPASPAFAGLNGTSCRDDKLDGGARIVDYNQDGLQDVLLLAANTGVPYAQVLESTGTGFILRQLAVPVRAGASANDSFASRTLDVNGDGLFDIVQIDSADAYKLKLWVQSGGRADLLVKVTNGLKAVHTATYTPLTQTSYTRPTGCSYPDRCYLGAQLVVSSEGASDPTSSATSPANGSAVVTVANHSYAGGVVDAMGDGFLGFRTHRIDDPRNGAVTILTFDQSRATVTGVSRHPFAGRVVDELHYTLAGTSYVGSRTATTYKVKESTAADGTRLWFPYAETVSTSEYDGYPPNDGHAVALSTTTTTISVDSFGNTVSEVVDRGPDAVGGGRVTTTTTRTFLADTASWLVGLVATESIQSTQGGLTQRRELAIDYEAGTGRVVNTRRQPNDPALARCSHVASRDGFGNATRVEETPDAGCAATATTRATTFDFTGDPDGIHWTRTSNALQHTQTRSVHAGLGVVYSTTDSNGLVTNRQYDGFGRLVQVANPDGTSTTTSYAACGSGALSYAFCVGTARSDGGYAEVDSDALGRVVRRWRRRAGGLDSEDTTYDQLGRQRSVSRPHRFQVNPAYPAVKTDYDGAGRPVSVCTGDSSHCRAIVYAGLSTTTYAQGSGGTVEQITERYPFGPLKATTRYPGNKAAVTRFTYGPFDTLVKVTDAAGNVVTQTFDALGRKTDLADADPGPVHWTFDAFDEAIAERRADGVTTTTSYDALGRILSRTPSDASYRDLFTYDTALHGLGLPASQSHTEVLGAASVSETFAYDALSRPASHAWNIDGSSYTIAWGYDDQGRPSTTTYPGAPGRASFGTVASYDADGLPFEVKDTANHSLWKRVTVDSESRILDEVLGNSVHNTCTYDPAFGWMTRTTATRTPGAAPYLTNESYDYLLTGDLKTRADNLQVGALETFGYDRAHQLTSVTLTGQAPQTLQYDAIGNLTANSALGLTFNYGGVAQPRTLGPHALTSLYNPAGNETYAMAYDLDGNLTTNGWAGATQMQWNAFGKLRAIQTQTFTGGANSERFEYDAAHDKVRKIVLAGARASITYVGGLFEVHNVAGSGVTDYVFHFRGGELIWRYRASSGSGSDELRYFHIDRQGSVIATTDAAGAVKERMSYDAFGARRQLSWKASTSTFWGLDLALLGDTRAAYTGHDYDDESFLIDMGARRYMPWLNRFMTPDSVVQDASNGLSWNRYTYVLNNPLRYRDPSGHRAIGDDEYSDEIISQAADLGVTVTELARTRMNQASLSGSGQVLARILDSGFQLHTDFGNFRMADWTAASHSSQPATVLRDYQGAKGASVSMHIGESEGDRVIAMKKGAMIPGTRVRHATLVWPTEGPLYETFKAFSVRVAIYPEGFVYEGHAYDPPEGVGTSPGSAVAEGDPLTSMLGWRVAPRLYGLGKILQSRVLRAVVNDLLRPVDEPDRERRSPPRPPFDDRVDPQLPGQF